MDVRRGKVGKRVGVRLQAQRRVQRAGSCGIVAQRRPCAAQRAQNLGVGAAGVDGGLSDFGGAACVAQSQGHPCESCRCGSRSGLDGSRRFVPTARGCEIALGFGGSAQRVVGGNVGAVDPQSTLEQPACGVAIAALQRDDAEQPPSVAAARLLRERSRILRDCCIQVAGGMPRDAFGDNRRDRPR